MRIGIIGSICLVGFLSMPFVGCRETRLAGDGEMAEPGTEEPGVNEEEIEDTVDMTADDPDETDPDTIEEPATIAWVRTYGTEDGDETLASIRRCSAGGYIAAGSISPSDTESWDYWVLRLDESGEIVWQKAYGGPEDDLACCIDETSDGGLIVGGESLSFGSGTLTSWILGLDAGGNMRWQRSFVSEREGCHMKALHLAGDGGFFIAGRYSLPEEDGMIVFWVAKLSGDGDVIWQKAYGTIQGEYANAVEPTEDGGAIVAGYTQSEGFDIKVMKLDEAGVVEWMRTFGNVTNDDAHAVIATRDGGYLVAGELTLNAGDSAEPVILKLDGEGNLLWPMSYGDLGYPERSVAGRLSDIRQVADGGFVTSAIVQGAAYPDQASAILKLDEDGEIVWRTLVDRPTEYYEPIVDNLFSIVESPDGAHVSAGETGYHFPGLLDAMVVKILETGRLPLNCPPGIGDEADALSLQACAVHEYDVPNAVRDTGLALVETDASWRNTDASSVVFCTD
jgi:hypothetical protein